MELCLAVWHCWKLHQKYRLWARRKKAFSHGENNDNWSKEVLITSYRLYAGVSLKWTMNLLTFFMASEPLDLLVRELGSRRTSESPGEYRNVRQASFSVLSVMFHVTGLLLFKLTVYWFVILAFTTLNQSWKSNVAWNLCLLENFLL